MKLYGITILRITVGAIYLMHAYLATRPGGAARISATLAGVAAPTMVAAGLVLAYAMGGLLLLLGIVSRWAAALTALVTAVVLVKLHLAEGFFLRGVVVDGPAGRAITAGYEYSLLLLAATLAVLFLGSGPVALSPSK